MYISLKGRTALITGGSRGLGLAMAKQFVESGANVAILARELRVLEQAEREIRKVSTDIRPDQVLALSCDVTNADEIAKAHEHVVSQYSKVDILVNNAGQSFARPFMELSIEDFQSDFNLKLFSALRLCKLVWPQMKAQRWGRIINVLHIGAKAPIGGSAPSSLSRAAGMSLTKVLSQEGAADGILVNGMMVGLIESDQWVVKAIKEGLAPSDLLAKMGKKIPLGRVGTAEEFANLACFLASDAAAYITGTAINVDGGLSPVV